MIVPLLIAAAMIGQAGSPDEIEPSELAGRADAIGREVIVDDRVRYFLESKRGQGFDEIHLRRTDIVLKLPARLKFPRSPTEPVVRARGILTRTDGRLGFDVTSLELLPNDPERLEHEIGRLRAEDFAGMRRWGLWAQRRGRELNEPKLVERGIRLEGEALWVEAARHGSDPLQLAERSADRPIPPEIRRALLHRGFRDKLRAARTAAEFGELAQRIERDLPDAVATGAKGPLDATLRDAYAKDPAASYRAASEADRKTLDRTLAADAVQALLESQLRDDPTRANELAEVASQRLSDRPSVAEQLRQRGLDEAEAGVTAMRQSEVEALAEVLRKDRQDERARRLLKTWLADRREHRVSPGDAEGRVLLALNYDRMLGDRATAAELLGEAYQIDPGSKAITEAYLRLGFRKSDRGWVDPRAERDVVSATNPAPAANTPSAASGDSLRGLTRGQVRARLGGKPDRISRSATQGQSVEQWIYSSPRGAQVINFTTTLGSGEPRAASSFSTND
ncbi:tetratricopeptide repeat protein [Tundrisphaera sp. TA3]|uniref:tetratricopeptide repeat protein n=1 Tax=Tundrisphaera sp. TA3 TaxID=3435775 RepID=UPI003EB74945